MGDCGAPVFACLLAKGSDGSFVAVTASKDGLVRCWNIAPRGGGIGGRSGGREVYAALAKDGRFVPASGDLGPILVLASFDRALHILAPTPVAAAVPANDNVPRVSATAASAFGTPVAAAAAAAGAAASGAFVGGNGGGGDPDDDEATVSDVPSDGGNRPPASRATTTLARTAAPTNVDDDVDSEATVSDAPAVAVADDVDSEATIPDEAAV